MTMHAMDVTTAAAKLEQAVKIGTERAGQVVKAVLEGTPKDAIVKASTIQWGMAPNGVVTMGVQGSYPTHKHAFGQVAEVVATRTGLRGLSDLVEATTDKKGRIIPAADWKKELALHTLTTTFKNSDSRHLVRIAGGQVKGFLSDAYRRLDCRPLLDGFINGAMAMQAVPFGGSVCDTKISMKMIVPQIYEIVPGEPVAFGLEFSNSDFGNGSCSVRAFILRLWCLNGATTEDVMRQVHLGRRLEDNIEYSKRTLELDTRATESALKDTVRGHLLPEKRESMVERIRTAQEESITWDRLKSRIAKHLTKDEQQKVQDSFTGPDVINLPPEPTVWRASNALSWLAHQVSSEDRKLELEKLAGSLLALPKAA